MEGTPGAFVFCLMILSIMACSVTNNCVYGDNSMPVGKVSRTHFHDQIRKMQASLAQRRSTTSTGSPSPAIAPAGPSPPAAAKPNVYRVTTYGADPTGKADSTDALLKAISDALGGPSNGFLMEGIVNLGGARIDLEGGIYLISRPLQFPVAGKGNLLIHGGTLKASNNFPTDGYLIDLSPASNKGPSYNYEFITLRDILLDSNYRGGGIRVLNSLRTSIDNCYVAHFSTNGILSQGGHETYIRNCYLGQHITAGGDRGEKDFSGTGINLMGNDNSVIDVVIFSAQVGIMVSGQANTISGVHCYNKATGWGGTGIYLKLPGLTQTRITNSYMDYTGIVAEDPVQLHISNTFFLGDAYILLKSIKGIAQGVTIVDNMFAGSGHGVDIVQLNGAFNQVDQVVVQRNQARGMNVKATVAQTIVKGNGITWTANFNSVLLFPNMIKHVDYSLSTDGVFFPNHALRNVSDNQVLIQASAPVTATVSVTAHQVLF